MKTFKLNKNQEIPALGFGTWQLTGDLCTEAIETALDVGYRHIDTAIAYYNHKEIAPAIKSSGLKREELFITSKLWRDSFHKKEAVAAGKQAVEDLGVEYLDLFLIHWPDREIPIMETLEGLFKLQEEGVIKEWGVSNFTINHLKDILSRGIDIANNQVEFHPSLNQNDLKMFCDEHHILLTAYSPIAQGQDLKLPLITDLAKKYDRTESQVILNWIMAKGIVAIPKATTKGHIEDNFKTIEWQLEPDDVEAINHLNRDNRLIMPDHNEFDY